METELKYIVEDAGADSCESEVEVEKESSPFTNELVLSMIFKKLFVCDLHRARCVSRLWNSLATNQLMKENHTHVRTLYTLNITDQYGNYSKFGKFSQIFENNPSQMFYSHFEIQDSALEQDELKLSSGGQIVKFFEQFVDKITHLKLRIFKGQFMRLGGSILTTPVIFPNLEELNISFSQKVLMELGRNRESDSLKLKPSENPTFPQLKKVSFDDNVDFDLDRRFCAQLAQNAPNLVSFQMPRIPMTQFKNVYQHKFKNAIEPIFILCKSLNRLDLYSLTEITLSGIIDLIEVHSVCLKSLKAVYEHHGEIPFKKFFDTVCSTLEDLTIDFMGNSERVSIIHLDKSISRLMKLKSINVPALFALTYFHLDKIKDYYPVLETITISSGQSSSLDEKLFNEITSTIECLQVTTLELPNFEPPTIDSLRKLEHVFPNLKKLALRISSQNSGQYLPVLWSMWTKSLRHLILYIGSIFEGGLDDNSPTWNLDNCFAGDLQLKQDSISNLKNLRELHLFAHSEEIILTDTTGLALIQLPELILLKGSTGLLNFSKEIQGKLPLYNYDLTNNIACSSTNGSIS